MANHDQIMDALEQLGANVDRANFSSKMQDPKFAEHVRTSLQKGGATVPDSSTFYQKYGNQGGATPRSSDDGLFSQIQSAALKSGYSGLSDEHKAALNNALMNVKSQNPNAFTSLDDVHSQMDKEAGVDMRSKVGRTLRTPLAGIVGTVEGAAGALGGAMGAQSGNRLEQAKEQGLNAAMEGLTAGKEGRGLEGMASDPANLIPALGLERFGANLASRAALRGLEGAAYGVTSNALNPSEEFAPLTSGIAGAAGAQIFPAAKKIVLAPFTKSIESKASNEAARQALAELEDAAIRNAAAERATKSAPDLRLLSPLSPQEEEEAKALSELLKGIGGKIEPKKVNLALSPQEEEEAKALSEILKGLFGGKIEPTEFTVEDILKYVSHDIPDLRIGSQSADARAVLDYLKAKMAGESPYTAMPAGLVSPSDEAALAEYAKIKNLKQEGSDVLGLLLNERTKKRLATYFPKLVDNLSNNTFLPNHAIKEGAALDKYGTSLYQGLLSLGLSKGLEDESKNQKDSSSTKLIINKLLK